MVKCPYCGKKNLSGVATVLVPCVSRDSIYLKIEKGELAGLRMTCETCEKTWNLRESTLERIRGEMNG